MKWLDLHYTNFMIQILSKYDQWNDDISFMIKYAKWSDANPKINYKINQIYA